MLRRFNFSAFGVKQTHLASNRRIWRQTEKIETKRRLQSVHSIPRQVHHELLFLQEVRSHGLPVPHVPAVRALQEERTQVGCVPPEAPVGVPNTEARRARSALVA
jgi:hypothetical protein